jgi:hypothetical protein
MHSCACRQSMNIIKRPRLILKKEVWRKYNRQYILGDTLGPILCYFMGHDPYLPNECNTVACKRCGRFID